MDQPLSKEGHSSKPFTMIAAIVLALVGCLQLVRYLLAWPVTIDGAVIPVWASAIVAVVAVALAAMVWREARK